MQSITGRQERFAQHFAIHSDAPGALVDAYDTAGWTEKKIRSNASQVLNSDGVLERIKQLRAIQTEAAAGFSVQDALARLIAIATADPNELIALKVGACRYCHGENHAYHWREREYLEALSEAEAFNRTKKATASPREFPSYCGGFGYLGDRAPHPGCPDCHGEGIYRIVPKDTENLSAQGKLLYGGVKHTAHGPQIIIADRMKALELAVRMLGGFDDKVTINANIKAMVAAVQMEHTDAQAAGRAYQDMIKLTLPAS